MVRLPVFSVDYYYTATYTDRLPLHYGLFLEILSQNWSINFCSFGFIFNLFLSIFASKAQKTVDHVPSFEIFQIETKVHLEGLKFKLEFWDENLKNRP